MNTLLLVGSLLIVFSILMSPLSNRVGMPVLLLFLGVGMLAGEDGPGGIAFNNVGLAYIIANMALAVILLDGGMRTRVESFRVGLKPALTLATLGVFITAMVCGLFAAWLLEVPIYTGLLIGAIISSTDAAAVFALLQGRGLHLNERVEATLNTESGSNDPMAIFLTLLLIELTQTQSTDNVWGTALLMLVQQFGLGAIAGLLGGMLMAWVVNRVSLVPAMYPLLVMAAGVCLFSGTNALGGSGFLAIYLMGVVLASRRIRMMPLILQIHDGLAWLAQMILFLLLGLLVNPSELIDSAPYALLIALVLIFVARPASTLLSLLPFGFSRNEHVFIGWVGLRGAVPIVLALFPVMAEVPGAELFFQVAFVVVLVSLILQGTTLAPLARKLKLEIPGGDTPKLRFELDHPAAAHYELLLVPLSGERWQKPVPLSKLKLPKSTRVAGIFRQGELMVPDDATECQDKDLVAVLAHEDQRAEVGQVLSLKPAPERLSDQRFFGDFTVNGEATLGDVQMAYGVKDVDSLDASLTLSDCFARLHHGHPVVGDRLRLGGIMLVVRAVEVDKVTRVGLKLRRDD